MLEVNKFKTMSELLKHQKELENAISDDDVLDEVKESIFIELVHINELVRSIYNVKETNRHWLELLLNMLNKRQDGFYRLHIISGENNNKKMYTFDDFNKVEVENIGKSRKWYTVFLTKTNNPIADIISPYENDPVSFSPELYGKTFILYEGKEGELCVPLYLSEERNISEFLDYGEERGLTKEEVSYLNEVVFNEYKNQNRTKKRELKK